jgi:hypothetical protein
MNAILALTLALLTYESVAYMSRLTHRIRDSRDGDFERQRRIRLVNRDGDLYEG